MTIVTGPADVSASTPQTKLCHRMPPPAGDPTPKKVCFVCGTKFDFFMENKTWLLYKESSPQYEKTKQLYQSRRHRETNVKSKQPEQGGSMELYLESS